jgi:DNA-binding transcriptional MocR family regulator
MLAALARHLGGQARWTPPAGGFGVWLALPDGLDAADLYRLSVERGAGFAPGAVFYPGGHRHETLRLCFSAAAPPAIDAGVARLGEALRELRRRRPRPPASPAVLPL